MNKKWLILITKCFAGFLVLLTLFSNTIYNMSIPAAAVQFPETGYLERVAEGEGVATFAVEDVYYADAAGSLEMHIKDGEAVTAGQALFTLKKDIDAIQKELEDLDIEEREVYLQIETIRRNIALAEDGAVQAENKLQKNEKTAELWEIALEEETLKNKITTAEKDVGDKKVLYDAGAVSLQELRTLEQELEDLYIQWDHLQVKKQKEQEKQDELNGKERESLEDTVKEKNNTVSGYTISLQETELKLEKIRLKRNRLQDQLSSEQMVAYAQADGIVVEQNSRLKESRHISEDEWIVKIGRLAEGYYTDIEFPETANFIAAGDEVSLDATSVRQYGLVGTVVKLYPEEGKVKAQIHFNAEGFTGGERIRCRVVNRLQTEGQILPQTAIHKDDDGYYLLYAETTRSTFGTETYAKKMMVSVQEKGDSKWVVYLYGYDTKIPVIVNSDKPVYEGDRIKIFSGSDIIEIRD